MTMKPVFSHFVENLLLVTLHFSLPLESKAIISFFELINFILKQYSIKNLTLN